MKFQNELLENVNKKLKDEISDSKGKAHYVLKREGRTTTGKTPKGSKHE